ncbi:class I SAM-dependent methyltransferase [[Phormidium] sp. ETS-05]|uniref:class I SAM-dependent methyltransferase n=1 Tax=[Phormidium] sp. ETS-05 TaxID=222819 RepID=UPI0018EEE5EC|nr:class I SAM-dependent methyltransferase [[Phormidium] sp. ETS-05]
MYLSIEERFKKIIPEPIKKIIRPVRNLFIKKNETELSFWRSRFQIDQGKFKNSHYQQLMLAIAAESSDNFLKGKIIADFGCGPRGSLVWASSASLRIGIDVLADLYADEFSDNITSHGMIYVKSTEKVIPLPSNFVDIMFTINAIDHVNDFPQMCNEIIRVLKEGGEFIGSFNLEEPASPCEPQQLNEKIIKENLLNKLEVQSYRITKKGPESNPYAPFFEGNLSYQVGEEGFLWVRARKPSN